MDINKKKKEQVIWRTNDSFFNYNWNKERAVFEWVFFFIIILTIYIWLVDILFSNKIIENKKKKIREYIKPLIKIETKKS